MILGKEASDRNLTDDMDPRSQDIPEFMGDFVISDVIVCESSGTWDTCPSRSRLKIQDRETESSALIFSFIPTELGEKSYANWEICGRGKFLPFFNFFAECDKPNPRFCTENEVYRKYPNSKEEIRKGRENQADESEYKGKEKVRKRQEKRGERSEGLGLRQT
jgi:hypothetical protein